ncbi:ATP-binding protein [Streptomyces parvus]|uniref:ATP-binding protein n=1 Tax=Streptomyces parvus TaxID=66428 RepID=UPI00340C59A0
MASETSEPSTEEIDLTPSPQLLEALGDIPFKPWQCLAELTDNAFDDFLTNPDPDGDEVPTVWITLPKPSDDDPVVSVTDNGRGMSRETLEKALKAGYSGKRRHGTLGLFGMGFNIATARLGYLTEVRTTRAGDPDWLVVEIDLRKLSNNDSFLAPLRRESKPDKELHGTEITVSRLRDEIAEDLRRTNRHRTIREDLGRVYSYLLRSRNAVPGLPDGPLSGRGFRLKVNEKNVAARLPCVWSASRSVMRDGREIPAIKPIDIPLPLALACMDCGHWQNPDLMMDSCTQCDGEDLQHRERRIHGWIGVQRYLDESDFGLDLLRNGRKIRVGDHTLFAWENPDTGQLVSEYPVDLPAGQGRIVGEIHLDHVPVGYQKIDFTRESREWRQAVIRLRGEEPMRPKKAKELGYKTNTSPLADIFRGYQENRPGARCLIPGDGSKAIHEAAREWGKKFHKGTPEYLTDEMWYQAVTHHDEVRDGGGKDGEVSAGPTSAGGTLSGRTGLAPLGGNVGGDQPPTLSGATAGEEEEEVETEEERFDRYRRSARKVYDLTGEVSHARLGRRQVTVYETLERLTDDRERLIPSVTRMGRGISLEVFVYGGHPIFREYGRDPRDYALMEIAQTLHAFDPDDQRFTAVTAEVTQLFPDQRVTDAALRERADSLLDTVRGLMAPVVIEDAEGFWNELPEPCRLRAERDAGRANPSLDWSNAIKEGMFTPHLDASGIAFLIAYSPQHFLDGAVFQTTWATWSDDETKKRQVAQAVRPLEILNAFVEEQGARTRLELSFLRLALDMLDESITRRDTP